MKSVEQFFDYIRGKGPGYLNVQGRRDLIGLARRICSQFPTLCNVSLNEIYVESTYKPRAAETAYWYLYQMLHLASDSEHHVEDIAAVNFDDDIQKRIALLQKKMTFKVNDENDPILRFYDSCDKLEKLFIFD